MGAEVATQGQWPVASMSSPREGTGYWVLYFLPCSGFYQMGLPSSLGLSLRLFRSVLQAGTVRPESAGVFVRSPAKDAGSREMGRAGRKKHGSQK